MYSVKEIFFTLQGEGANAGTPAVFLRFAGCNLWSGREKDRARAVCRFCDTDFVGTGGAGGGKFRTAASLAKAVAAKWPRLAGAGRSFSKFVVCTGGEPLLQLDAPLIETLHDRGFRVAIETNGTLAAPRGVDWTCVSPKAGAPLALGQGDELKLVYPQKGAEPERYTRLDFDHFFLQPMDGPRRDEYTRLAAAYCLRHPRWQLSLQMHKLIGIP
jgi:7-carboxy-7-deazaguanine synthase